MIAMDFLGSFVSATLGIMDYFESKAKGVQWCTEASKGLIWDFHRSTINLLQCMCTNLHFMMAARLGELALIMPMASYFSNSCF